MPASDPLIGRRLGDRLELRRRLGQGGMGRVYLAHHLELDKSMAVKILRPDVAEVPDRVVRFRREAQAASRLDHPHVVRVHDFGQDGEDNLLYIAMEYVEGRHLGQVIESASRLDARRAARFAVQILAALAEAHDQGIVHRDLKPGNVIVTQRPNDDGVMQEIAKVCDFGLAKVMAASFSGQDLDAVTEQNVYVGTPAFMAPEQVNGQSLDGRTDLYAVGCLLYTMLTGHVVFDGENPVAVMLAHVRDTPVPLSDRVWDIDPILDEIVTWAMEKSVADRCPSARQLRKALLGLLEVLDEESEATQPSQPALPGGPSLSEPQIADTVATPRASTAVINYATPPSSLKDTLAIAVLPFVNLSPDPRDALFADGITDALITGLAQITELRVTSRTSAMRFKGSDHPLPEIARQLGVTHILEGSVVRADDQARISARLVHAAEDRPLWAERYDRPVKNILALHDEVTLAVGQAIRTTLAPATSRSTPQASVDPAAYDAYVKGRHFAARRTPTALKRSILQFRQALEVNPRWAAAYAGLADGYNLLASYSVLPPALAHPKAKAAAERALELDDRSAEAHTARAFALFYGSRDFRGAEAAYLEALTLNPSYARAHQWYSEMLSFAGRHDEANAHARRAQSLDPLFPVADANRAKLLLYARRPQDALRVCQDCLSHAPDAFVVQMVASWCLTALGRHDEAVALLNDADRNTGGYVGVRAALGHAHARSGASAPAKAILHALTARAEDEYIPALYFAAISMALGEYDEAFLQLFRAIDEGTEQLMALDVDPSYDNLRRDARFAQLRTAVGLPFT